MKKPDQVANTWMRGFESLGEKRCRLLNRHAEWDDGVSLSCQGVKCLVC